MAHATNEPADAALSFCQKYVNLAGDLAGYSKAFIIIALVLGFAYGVVEIIKKYRQPAPAAREIAPGAIKEVIDALRAFFEALAKAPTWLGLFGVGILLFWIAGVAIPAKCELAMTTPQAVRPGTPAGDHDQNVSAGNALGNASGNSSVQGNSAPLAK